MIPFEFPVLFIAVHLVDPKTHNHEVQARARLSEQPVYNSSVMLALFLAHKGSTDQRVQRVGIEMPEINVDLRN